MSSQQDYSDWLIEELEKAIATLNGCTKSLNEAQQRDFQLRYKLLREHEKSMENRSRSTQSVRRRARTLLQKIYTKLGAEVFVLSTIGPSITKLGENALRIDLKNVQIWWESVSDVTGLAEIASDLCKENEIESLVPTTQKRQPEDDPEARNHGFSKRPKRSPPTVTQSVTQSQSVQGEQQERPQTTSDYSILSNTPEKDQLVLESASLAGIAKLFDSDMCNAIRTVLIGGETKAAITMVFPKWVGPVDCLMSLDICEWAIPRLAMALFQAEVKWVQNRPHVVFESGRTVTMPASEVTLKGAEDEAIKKVFGAEVHNAITECQVRKRETRRATECVSMIFTENGGFINLSLGLRASLQIEDKLSI